MLQWLMWLLRISWAVFLIVSCEVNVVSSFSSRNFGMHIFFSLEIQNCLLLGHDKPIVVNKNDGI